MIYIHIPFCHHKCTYCAFYSAAGRHDTQQYVEALCREISLRAHYLPNSQHCKHHPSTLYFGGGTPTLLPIEQLRRIIDCLSLHFDLTAVEESTIEANPEDLTSEYLIQLRQLGFNRLSIGIQSFNDKELKLLNRVHSAAQAVKSVANARQAGFDNISIDLIYGLPGQSTESWGTNLQQAAALPVTHLSCYALTVEPCTMLARQIEMGRIPPVSSDTVAEHYQQLCRWAASEGFEQYEISNFCHPGFASRHNSRYWDRTPYLGFGAAAHSFDGIRRRWNVANTETYCQYLGNPESKEFHASLHHIDKLEVTRNKFYYEEELLSPTDAFNEYVMTSLRTTRGIEKKKIPNTFSAHLTHRIAKYVSAGLLTETSEAYQPTQEGMLHADGIAADLFI